MKKNKTVSKKTNKSLKKAILAWIEGVDVGQLSTYGGFTTSPLAESLRRVLNRFED